MKLNALDGFAGRTCLLDRADECVGVARFNRTKYLDNYAPVFARNALYRR